MHESFVNLNDFCRAWLIALFELCILFWWRNGASDSYIRWKCWECDCNFLLTRAAADPYDTITVNGSLHVKTEVSLSQAKRLRQLQRHRLPASQNKHGIGFCWSSENCSDALCLGCNWVEQTIYFATLTLIFSKSTISNNINLWDLTKQEIMEIRGRNWSTTKIDSTVIIIRK